MIVPGSNSSGFGSSSRSRPMNNSLPGWVATAEASAPRRSLPGFRDAMIDAAPISVASSAPLETSRAETNAWTVWMGYGLSLNVSRIHGLALERRDLARLGGSGPALAECPTLSAFRTRAFDRLIRGGHYGRWSYERAATGRHRTPCLHGPTCTVPVCNFFVSLHRPERRK